MELEQFKEPLEGKIIDKVKFGIFSQSQIERLSQLHCKNPGIFEVGPNGEKRPRIDGVLDLGLGVSNVLFNCSSCQKSMADCPGHFGHIDLEFPCFNIGYMKLIIKILHIICKKCSELLLSNDMRKKFSKMLSNSGLPNRQKKIIFENVVKEAKKIKICPNCSSYNGSIKKINGFKLVHDRYKVNNSSKKVKQLTQDSIKQLKLDTHIMQQFNQDLKANINKIQEPLTPSDVLHLFQNIRKEYIHFFSMCQGCAPTDMIFTRLLVPPSCVRPSVFSETQTGSNEDDLTIKLESVIWANKSIIDHRKNGSNIFLMMEDWDYLQSYVSLYINGELSGLPPHLTDASAPRGCIQRLKGKYGRFRGNLSGKRVDFSGRTVISPDPNLRIDQVAIPLLIAKTMTYPEVVNMTNLNFLKKLVTNGPDIHPGANYVINRSDQSKQFLKFGNREKVANNLRPGDIVERHMQNGDIVLFNRQPSLHRLSIMAHKALIMDHRTFRFNECVCTPYNADFDGDEMNVHLPQTEEAKAEASTLMSVKNNILTPRNGEPLISATQDFITGAYLLTRKDNFLSRDQISQMIAGFLCDEDISEKICLPPPAILRPVELWTGKQAITSLLSPFYSFKSRLNLIARSRTYTTNEDLCSNDGYCTIFNGELMCGVIDKNLIGSGSKNTIFYHILREYGPDECSKVMWRLSRITPHFLMNKGFSIGINDVTPSDNLLHLLDDLVDKGYEKCEDFIRDCNNGDLPTQPGCSLDETLEALILRELSTIRDSAGKVCLQELPSSNSPLIMALSGSKGSNINISQMVACVGQQALNGKRTPDGFEARTLPHFLKHQKTPDAKGFVKSSFYSGLSPTEFFFHTMAGREGLVDTAVKTAETGYMQRRLVKCLEDLCVHYDDTVRSASNNIVQFIYGGDSLDPIEMESGSNPINFEAVFNNITNHLYKTVCSEECVQENEIEQLINRNITKWTICPNLVFVSNLTKFLHEKCRQMTHYYNKFKSYISELDASPIVKMTRSVIDSFMKICQKKYAKSKIEPGTAVGAICAQSIGEPGTQMTLKTFHFAGVATMNITLGVPRLKEIINATINISTPVITAPLDNAENLAYARIVKARIEKTILGDVCEYIEEIYLPNICYLLLKLDMSRIKLLQLEVTEEIICNSIANSKLKIKHEQISIVSKGIIAIIPADKPNSSKYFVIQQLKVSISNVTIKGFDGVNKAIIHMDEYNSNDTNKNDMRYKLIIEGNDIGAVMTTLGIKSTQVTSNSTHSVYKCLGIEAARSTIINEIVYTMKNHGMSIDTRHVMLLADLMTYKGEILGITRYGLSKMKDSVLMLASFEKTSDHLFDAAYFGDCDNINGVSESIIMGRPIKLGTGLFKLLYKPNDDIIISPSSNRLTLFEETYKNC